MTAENEIKNLSEVLADYLGPNKRIVDKKITALTAPGENFGSIMLKVDLTVKNGKGSEENIYAVAKKIPKLEVLRENFNIQVTYKNEAAIYTTVAPTLKEFQRSHGVTDVIDCFAEVYGARFNLNGDSDIVDDDAVLILENLISKGYQNIDRLKGFDLEGAKFLLRDLAKFHAVPLALKLQKPKLFEKNVKSACAPFKLLKVFFDMFTDLIGRILSENEECVPLMHKVVMWGGVPPPKAREPFATLGHGDLWVNNTMQKFVNGKMVGNKFVDFQVLDYRSGASDVFFFLWSSVPKSILEEHLDYLLEYYHEHFIKALVELKCDPGPFSYANFLEEIRLDAGYEFGHAMMFSTFVVNGKKGGSPITDHESEENKQRYFENVPQVAKEKAWYMVLECEKRGWLY